MRHPSKRNTFLCVKVTFISIDHVLTLWLEHVMDLVAITFCKRGKGLKICTQHQGGRSCAGARVAPAEKFGLGRKFYAWTYAILSQIKICRDLRTFWRSLGKKKCLFGSKTVFLGQEVHYYMVYIAYFTDLILQICDYAQKRRIWREICKYALDENFHCHTCSRRKAAKFCHPVLLSLIIL